MTPARERLLRLALEMPEQAVATIARSILWTCPGMEDATKPMLVRAKVELLEGLGSIAHDPKLRALFKEEIERLKAAPRPVRAKRDSNIVPLFGAN
jgi:hypothetical protein